jgi:hypothetical protein
MPLWVRIWFQTPLLDRRARVYMWHHGYWAVPPSIDWVPPSLYEGLAGGTPLTPLRRHRLPARLHKLRYEVSRSFGIHWSWWIRVPAYLVTAIICGLIWGLWGAALGVIAVEFGSQAVSFYSGRKLRRPEAPE